MNRLKLIWRSIDRYVYLLIGIVTALVVYQLLKQQPEKAAKSLEEAFDAFEAEAQVTKLEAAVGKAEAVARVEEVYHEQIKKLSAEQKAKADKLRNDPVALSRFLLKAGRR